MHSSLPAQSPAEIQPRAGLESGDLIFMMYVHTPQATSNYGSLASSWHMHSLTVVDVAEDPEIAFHGNRPAVLDCGEEDLGAAQAEVSLGPEGTLSTDSPLFPPVHPDPTNRSGLPSPCQVTGRLGRQPATSNREGGAVQYHPSEPHRACAMDSAATADPSGTTTHGGLQSRLQTAPGCLAIRETGQLGLSQLSLQRSVSGHRSLLHRLRQQRVLDGHHGCVNTVAFTPDGSSLISGSDDTDIIIWDWQTGRQRLKYHSGHVNNVFQAKALRNADNRVIVSCAADGQVRIGHIPEGAATSRDVLTSKIGKHQGRSHKLALELTSDDCFLSCGEDGAVRHFDIREANYGNRKLFDLTSYSRGWRRRLEIYALALNPVRPWEMAVAAADENVRVYDFRRSMGGREANYGPSDDDRQTEILHMLCPRHLRGTSSQGSHTTCVAYNCRGELLATYGDESIYLFDYNAPVSPKRTASSAAMATDLSQSPRKMQHCSSQQGEPCEETPASGASPDLAGRAAFAQEQSPDDEVVAWATQEGEAAGPASSPSQVSKKEETSAAPEDAGRVRVPPDSLALSSHALRDAFSESSCEEDSPAEAPVADSNGEGQGQRPEDFMPLLESDEARADASSPKSRGSLSSMPALVGSASGNSDPETLSSIENETPGLEPGSPSSATVRARRSGRAHAEDADTDEVPDFVSNSDSNSGSRGNGSEAEPTDSIYSSSPESESKGDASDSDDHSGDDIPGVISDAPSDSDGPGESDPEDHSGEEMPGVLSDSPYDSDGPDWRPASARGTHSEEEPEHAQETDYVIQKYSGHRNSRTVKGVNFCGANDEYVISGSDCGNVFIWDKASGQLEWMQQGDDTVVNCLERHPHLPLHLATSGIDDSIKIWAPDADKPVPMSQEARDNVKRMASIVSSRSRTAPLIHWPPGADDTLASLLQGHVTGELLEALQGMHQAAGAVAAVTAAANAAEAGEYGEDYEDEDEDYDDEDEEYSGDELEPPQCRTQ